MAVTWMVDFPGVLQQECASDMKSAKRICGVIKQIRMAVSWMVDIPGVLQQENASGMRSAKRSTGIKV